MTVFFLMRVLLFGLSLLLSLAGVQAGMAPTVIATSLPQPFQTSQNDLGCAQNLTSELAIETCIMYVFGPDYKIALAVAKAESRLNPRAVNRNIDEYGNVWSSDVGVYQLNDYYHKGVWQMSTLENIEYAHKLYLSDGWTQWAAYNNGSYLDFVE